MKKTMLAVLMVGVFGLCSNAFAGGTTIEGNTAVNNGKILAYQSGDGYQTVGPIAVTASGNRNLTIKNNKLTNNGYIAAWQNGSGKQTVGLIAVTTI